MTEAVARFPCFGSTCGVYVIDAGGERAVAFARRCLEAWHRRFSRFEPRSELSRLNADRRARVPVSGVMGRFVEAAIWAARRTGGLVDATLVDQIEAAGYTADLGEPVPLHDAVARAPAREPASANPRSRWRELAVDRTAGVVTRPPGVRLDSGGLAKGMFADLLAAWLAGHASFAVECAGDLRVGGAGAVERPVEVTSPFDGQVLHRFAVADAGAATSGIGRRSWLDAGGAPAHHLLDPATGRPAYTGIVQATALAPTALEAEALAKAAVLSGPSGGRRWLAHGGVLVFEDGSHEVVDQGSED